LLNQEWRYHCEEFAAPGWGLSKHQSWTEKSVLAAGRTVLGVKEQLFVLGERPAAAPLLVQEELLVRG
jgi:hypothetical protein